MKIAPFLPSFFLPGLPVPVLAAGGAGADQAAQPGSQIRSA